MCVGKLYILVCHYAYYEVGVFFSLNELHFYVDNIEQTRKYESTSEENLRSSL